MSTRARIGAPAAVVLTLLMVGAASGQNNVARDRPFRCSDEVMDGWTGLVDGVTDSDSAPGCFATGNGNEFPKTVTIDLQRVHQPGGGASPAKEPRGS